MSTPRQRSSAASSTKRKSQVATAPAVPLQAPMTLPTVDDQAGWRAYWQAQGQPWRTEPEIDEHRQQELEVRRALSPNVPQGNYPFRNITLTRADVEWLLATHKQGHGPSTWNGMRQREPEGLDLRGTNLSHVDLSYLPLAHLRAGLTHEEWSHANEEQRTMAVVSMEGVSLRRAHLEEAYLYEAHLEKADLRETHLEGAHLRRAHLEGALLRGAHLEGAKLRNAHVEGSDLGGVFFTSGTNLEGLHLGNEQYGCALLAGVRWDDVELSRVNWTQVKMLGDESQAHQRTGGSGTAKPAQTRLEEYQKAVRANRQLAVALQGQGLNEEATRFAYRAQVLQKTVFHLQMTQPGNRLKQRLQFLGAWFFSWFLFLIAGYGYKPGRSFLAYFLVISGFATAYYFLGQTVGPTLSPLGAFVFSMTSFHGRGFFPGNNISLDDPLTVLAAFEALVGLIIEVTFIATLTQRFFNR
jgi:uncharacterized protein YjbI with pentapeptide repeats